MNNKIIRGIGTAVLVCLWAVLALSAWLRQADEMSEAERRPLAQLPELSTDTLLSGTFMSDFESYTLDQFPLRDGFRQLKALFHYNVLNQKDNNDIYIAEGYAAKLEYPLDQSSIDYALERFNHVYEKYLKDTGSKVFFTVAPDKGYYLAEENGYPALDYGAMFDGLRAGMPWATFVDLTDCLDIDDYYRTDTHWRQERLLPAAKKLAEAMGVTVGEFTRTELERPFYGVYYGQAALPMEPEKLYVMQSDVLADCTVYQYETGKTTGVYDMEKLAGKDPYEVFLSGSQSLLTIENPNAATDRELIVFRDSFGSSMIPLLVEDYRTVTLVDIRYMASDFVGMYVDFHGQDVLFLYSTLVLNNSNTIK